MDTIQTCCLVFPNHSSGILLDPSAQWWDWWLVNSDCFSHLLPLRACSRRKLDHGIQDNLEWKRTMKSLPFSIYKATVLIFLWHQYGIAIAVCANFQTPNFKGSACAGLQAFDLKCPLEAFGGQIQHFYCIQKSFIPKSCVLGGANFAIIILSSTVESA